jgi:cell division protein FtsX
MRIPFLMGEDCRESENSIVVINRSFADTYFGGISAIGHHLVTVPANPFTRVAEIRGIVADAREEGLNREPIPTVYRCNSAPIPSPLFLIRTSVDSMAMAETIRRKIHEVEPSRSVYDVIPLEDHLDDTFAENRLRAILLTFFALTAVLLACIGLYGTVSYFVNMRRREIGLRIALGALRKEIVSQFMWQGIRVCLLGSAVGIGLALALGRTIKSVLYGVSSTDPITFGAVVVMMLGAGGLASLLPALRAARLQPMQVLRDE